MAKGGRSTAAHQIRTPLSIIMGFSEILASDKISEQEQRELAAGIFEQSKLLRDLINDIMDLARIKSGGRGSLNVELVDIKKFLSAFIDSVTRKSNLGFKLDKHEIRIMTCENDLPAISIDQTKIRCVLQNLLSNAAKYSKKDSPISIRIHSNWSNDRQYACIDIIDNGYGLRPDELDEVFKPFWRSKHIAPDIQGTGIGLAIVKEVIELHGGFTRIQSTLDVGTIVSIHLPAADKIEPTSNDHQ
jgi:signal transduction histidine kinase